MNRYSKHLVINNDVTVVPYDQHNVVLYDIAEHYSVLTSRTSLNVANYIVNLVVHE